MILLKISFTLIMIVIVCYIWITFGEVLYNLILDHKKWNVFEPDDIFYTVIWFLYSLVFTLIIICVITTLYIGGK